MFRIQPGDSGPDSPDVDGGLATVPPDDRRIQQPSQLQARHTPCAVRLAPTFRAAASLLHNVATMSAQASARGRSCSNDAFVWVSSPLIFVLSRSPEGMDGYGQHTFTTSVARESAHMLFGHCTNALRTCEGRFYG